jgi:Fe-S-cluster-containing hydrogenase component 2
MDTCLAPLACGWWCLKSCPEIRIVEIGGLLAMDCDICSDMPACAEACPGGALSVYGRSMSVQDVVRKVESVKEVSRRLGLNRSTIFRKLRDADGTGTDKP